MNDLLSYKPRLDLQIRERDEIVPEAECGGEQILIQPWIEGIGGR